MRVFCLNTSYKYFMDDYINTEVYDFSNDASASSFGWNFQSNAGIFLFLKYIKESKSIKIESKLQDIEIILNDGQKILAQAKSSCDYTAATDKKEKFKDAIISLAKCQKGKNQLIFISNISDVLTTAKTVFDNNVVSYSSCLKGTKKEIDDVFASISRSIEKKRSKETDGAKQKQLAAIQAKIKNFDKSKLYISVVYPFFGDENNRYKIIGDSVLAFLVDVINLGRNDAISIKQRLLDHWQLKFQHNSTKPDRGTEKAITKEEFIWPIAVFLIEDVNIDIDDCLSFYPDKALKREVERKMSSTEFLFHERFEFSNAVIQDYVKFKKEQYSGEGEIEKSFIKESWGKYQKEFADEESDCEMCEYMTKAFIYRVITNYINMNKISTSIEVKL